MVSLPIRSSSADWVCFCFRGQEWAVKLNYMANMVKKIVLNTYTLMAFEETHSTDDVIQSKAPESGS